MTNQSPLIVFNDISFSWIDDNGDLPTDLDGNPLKPIFDHFSAQIPQGFISLVGQNGTGKSTFLLLSSGRIMPTKGRVLLFGTDTRVLSGFWADEKGSPGSGLNEEIEHKRNLLCSFIYQNMEFEDQGPSSPTIGSLFEYVYENSGYEPKTDAFFNDVLKTFEIESLCGRRFGALSKGEIQRTLLAFSALYGSRVIMMDEPLFAMEQYQKERALEFFGDISRRMGVSIIVSLHELALTRKYSDTVMLFYPDRRIDMGTCDEVLTDEALEKAYGVPSAMLADAERLTRQSLAESARIRDES
jgi:iron complex transport system ATP-binding protein